MKKQLLLTRNHKAIVFFILLMSVFSWLLSGAYRIQVVEGEANLRLATYTNLYSERLRAARGIVYDRNGYQLVKNDSAFNVYANPQQISASEETDRIAQVAKLFSLNEEDLLTKYRQRAYTKDGKIVAEKVLLLGNIPYEDFLRNFKDLSETDGIDVLVESKRTYSDPTKFAHLLGYTGQVNAEDVKQNSALDGLAVIGREGIERSYDAQLRGTDGMSTTSSTNGETESTTLKSAVPGENLYLSIDAGWQKALYKLLEKAVTTSDQGALGGAAVVMEANTGEVISMVNYPSYDNNVFSGSISQEDYDKLVNTDSSPLLNRAIAMQIPTGSVYKVFMATAMQQEGAVSKGSEYNSGCFELPGDYKICEADKKDYGRLNLVNAIARSSNPYFCQAIVNAARVKGSDVNAINAIGKYMTTLSFGKVTGINLPGEQPGVLPSPEKKKQLLKEPWYLADLCNTVIGQGIVTATPIQLATATSALFNGGKVFKPQLVGRVDVGDGKFVGVSPEQVGKLEVEDKYIQVVQQGMKEAIQYGSAAALKKVPGEPYAKTGSAEATYVNKQGKLISGAHSWALGKFSYNDKDYVYVINLQFGGRGFKSVYVAADFIKCIYNNLQQC